MRHGNKRTRFGRQGPHRAATLRNMARSVLLHERIRTTQVKAKQARRVVETLITIAKEDTLSRRRKAFTVLGDRKLVKKLFKEIAPMFRSRNGGYTRIIPFDFRKGDGASMVLLELTERKPEEAVTTKKVKKTAKDAKEKVSKKDLKPREKRPEQAEKHSVAPEVAPEVREEKTVEEIKKERARDEERKMQRQKGFMKKVKGFFRRKTNM